MSRKRTVIGLVAVVLLGTLAGAGFLVYRQLSPGAPQALRPEEGESLVNGSVTEETWAWEFEWSAVPGAEEYHLQVVGPGGDAFIDKVTEEPVHRQVYGSGWSFGDGLLLGWTWKVRARVNGRWSAWSAARTFDVRLAEKKPTVSQEEYDRRIKTEFAGVYLIRGKENAHYRDSTDDASKLMSGIQRCLDHDPPDGRLRMRGEAPLRVMEKVGLVKDVEALGMKQKLGRVLAFDADRRALVIDVGAPPGPREEWKGAAELDRLVTAWTVRRFLSRATDDLRKGKEHPDEQLAFLQFRGKLADELFRDGGFEGTAASKDRLKRLLDGPAENRMTSAQVGDLYGPDKGIVVYPVKDFRALAGKIDFAEVLYSDPETRVLILGPLKKK